MKEENPFKYSTEVALKKIEQHKQAVNKLEEYTSKADSTNRFRNRMLNLLEKTNERVTLDRPFLIQEKMSVIIAQADKMDSRNNSAEFRT